MRKHLDSANTLLMELLVVILFFMLCMTTVVEAFGAARVKSIHATATGQAMLRAENLAERLYAGQDAEAFLREEGFLAEGDAWTLKEKDYTLTATVTGEDTGAGVMRTLLITASRGEDQLFELPACRYEPGEVQP